MTAWEYTDWRVRQRARGRADAEYSVVVGVCCLFGLAVCVSLAWLIFGGGH